MGQPVIAGDSFTIGLRSEFYNAYDVRYKGLMDRIGRHMAIGLPSTRSEEPYFYFEAVAAFKRWVRGEMASYKGFRGVKWTVVNYDWQRAVDWHYRDESDDQSKTLVQRVRQLASRAAWHDERIFMQIMTNTTDADLLPAIPNAPDGAALYATTAGGAYRFGVPDGNIVTGGGIATAALVRTDILKAEARFTQMQDPQGLRLHDPEVIMGPKSIYFNPDNIEVFEAAIYQKITQGTNAGVSNLLIDALRRYTLVPHPQITDNDFYIFLDDAPVKPIFSQEREPLRDAYADFDNSDETRNTGFRSLTWFFTRGYGVGPAFYTVKVNN